MFFAGVVLFSIVATALSYIVSKSENLERGKVAFSTVLIAWASLLAGLVLSKAG